MKSNLLVVVLLVVFLASFGFSAPVLDAKSCISFTVIRSVEKDANSINSKFKPDNNSNYLLNVLDGNLYSLT